MNHDSSHRRAARTVGAPGLDATPELIGRTPGRVEVRRKPGGLPTHLSLRRQVAMVALWPMLEQFMASLVGLVDTALAGHLPVEAVASTNAVSVASFTTWLMGLCQGALGVGSTALVARAVGANHRREAHAAIGQSMLLGIVWGLCIGAAFFAAAPLFGAAFGLSGRAHELCTTYLRLLAAAAPCMSVLFVGASCLRGAGDFRASVLIMAAVNAVNIAVSVLLVAWGMGVTGVAIGTVAAWTVGAVLMIAKLLGRRAGAVLHPHRMRWQPQMARRLVRLGIPSLIEHAAYWAGHAAIMVVIARLGDMNLIGAHSIGIRIEAFSFLPGYALGLAAATMAGQYLGAGQPRMAARAVWACWVWAAGIMGVLGLLFMAVPRLFVLIITDEPAFTGIVPKLLFMAGWSQIGLATSMVLSGALRGAGDVKASMVLMLASIWLVRVPAVWFVGLHLGYGLVGIWFVSSAELMLRGGLFLGRFLQGGWTKVKV